jgi:hypothetical protein
MFLFCTFRASMILIVICFSAVDWHFRMASLLARRSISAVQRAAKFTGPVTTRSLYITPRRFREEDMDDLEKNQYYSKYAGKIANLQKYFYSP